MAKKYVCYIIIFIAVLLTLSDLVFSRVWFTAHEGLQDWRNFILMDQFKKSFLSGNLYPRWMPDLYGGYGYPTFLFYQPGFFFIGLLFSFLPGYPLSSFYFLILFLFIVGSIGVFEIALIIIKEKLAALFVAIMFLLTPYIYVDLFIREDLGELTAMLLTPVPILFLLKFIQNLENKDKVSYTNLTFLVFSFGLVFISHPATALFYVPTFVLLAILLARGLRHPKIYLVNIFIAVLLAFLWTSSYWFPLIQMSRYVPMGRLIDSYHKASEHVVYLSQLFSRFWGFGASYFGRQDRMPFPLGAVHFVAAFLGFCLGFKNRLVRNSFFIYVGLIFLMTPSCVFLWDKILILRYVQFPWRILSVTAVFQALAILGFGLYLKDEKNNILKIFFFLIIGITIFWHWPAFKAGGHIDLNKEYVAVQRNIRGRFNTLTDGGEFTPKLGAKNLAALGPRENKRRLVQIESKKKNRIWYVEGHSQFRIRLKAELHEVDTITINQVYLPDWKIVLNKKELDQQDIKSRLSPDGRIRIGPLSPGTYEVVAYYKGPPYSSLRIAVVMILAVGIIMVLFSYNKRAFSK
jgi:hypothetical protein